jgi:hypothetical protein
VYLLTGCDQVWRALGATVLADRSIRAVLAEVEDRRRPWSSSATAVMQWAAHFWNVDRLSVKFPYVFERVLLSAVAGRMQPAPANAAGADGHRSRAVTRQHVQDGAQTFDRIGGVVDLAPDREDGYDLTDWLAERRHVAVRELACALGAPAGSELA